MFGSKQSPAMDEIYNIIYHIYLDDEGKKCAEVLNEKFMHTGIFLYFDNEKTFHSEYHAFNYFDDDLILEEGEKEAYFHLYVKFKVVHWINEYKEGESDVEVSDYKITKIEDKVKEDIECWLKLSEENYGENNKWK